MKITLTQSESRALNDLRGLPKDVHYMVMAMELTPEGNVIEGEMETFESLVTFVSNELASGTVSNSNLRSLTSLCVKIDPACLDWLGS